MIVLHICCTLRTFLQAAWKLPGLSFIYLWHALCSYTWTLVETWALIFPLGPPFVIGWFPGTCLYWGVGWSLAHLFCDLATFLLCYEVIFLTPMATQLVGLLFQSQESRSGFLGVGGVWYNWKTMGLEKQSSWKSWGSFETELRGRCTRTTASWLASLACGTRAVCCVSIYYSLHVSSCEPLSADCSRSGSE
jgi:hypothetical protein